MKELIGAAIFVVGLLGGGNLALKKTHDLVRREALIKVQQGLPSLVGLTQSLRGRKSR